MSAQSSTWLGSPVNDSFLDHHPSPTIPPVIADGTLTSDPIRVNTTRKDKKTKRQYNIRNRNRPKRPLSAYNLFFRYERERLVRETLNENGHADVNVEGKIKSQDKTRTGKRVHRKTHGAIGFAELGKHISEAWKSLGEKDRAPFQAEAEKEKVCYQRRLGAMSHRAFSGNAVDIKRGSVHAREKCKMSNFLADNYARENNENLDKEESFLHQRPGSDPPGHPTAYFDYYGYCANERLCAPSAFVPSQPTGPGILPAYAAQLPYSSYQPRTPKKGENSNSINLQQLTAHAFLPPYPHYNGHTNSNRLPPHHLNQGDVWAQESERASPCDFAFQCEVCNNAVFSTFQECADHEEVCVESSVTRESLSSLKKESQCNRKPEYGNSGSKKISQNSLKMSPLQDRSKADVEDQQAVEAVMMLKKPVECGEKVLLAS